MQVTFDEARGEAVYTLTTAQADEGEGSPTIKLRNVKGQAGVEEGSAVDDLIVLTLWHVCTSLRLCTLQKYVTSSNGNSRTPICAVAIRLTCTRLYSA